MHMLIYRLVDTQIYSRRTDLPKQHTAIVIHSPHSGRSTQLPAALKFLEQANIAIAEVLPIMQLDGLPAQGSIWQEQGINLAIAAGGDGLIGGVITHIAESHLPVGILPLGTANDIARSLNIPQDLQQAVAVIRQGRTVAIDIGIAEPAEQAPHQISQQGQPKHAPTQIHSHGFFAHTLIVGLNVQFARLATNVATRQRYGRWIYPIAALEVLLNHEPLKLDIHIEDLLLPRQHKIIAHEKQEEPIIVNEPMAFHCRALQAAIINAPIFGGKWNITLPNASMNDHLLDIVIIEAIEVQNLVTAFGHLFNTETISATSEPLDYSQQSLFELADLTSIPGIRHIQARSITIATNNDPEDVTLDGEIRGQTPIHAQIADIPLQVIIPNEKA